MKGMRYLIIIFLILTIPVNGQKRNTYGFYNTGNTPFYVLWANETLAPEISLEGWYEVPPKDDVSVTTYGGNSANLFAFAKRNKDGNLVSVGLYRRSNKKQVNYMEVPVSLISGKLNQRYSLDKADAKRNTPDITEGYVPFTLYIMDKGYTVDYDEYEQINMSVDENTPTFTVVPKSQAQKKLTRPVKHPNYSKQSLTQQKENKEAIRKAQVKKKLDAEYAKESKMNILDKIHSEYHNVRKTYNGGIFSDCDMKYEYLASIDRVDITRYSSGQISGVGYIDKPIFKVKKPRKMPYIILNSKRNPNSKLLKKMIEFDEGKIKNLKVRLVTCEKMLRHLDNYEIKYIDE